MPLKEGGGGVGNADGEETLPGEGSLRELPDLGHAERGRLHWWKSPLSHRPHHPVLSLPRARDWKGGGGLG